MKGYYKSRATQLKAFAANYRKGRRTLFDSLKDAAMVAATEERCRTLELIRLVSSLPQLTSAITAMPVMEVLGFKPKKGASSH